MGKGTGPFVDPLFVAYPELARAIDRLCELPPWQMTGASALVVSEGALVLELTKPKHWQRREDGVTIVGLGAIGGSLEPGETLLACLQREAHEELGAPIETLSSAQTAIVYEREQVTRLGLLQAGHPLPALLTVSENLYRPELGPAARTLAIATFWARLDGAPRLGDLYGMLTLPLEQVRPALAALPCPPGELAALNGVRLVTRAPLPPHALLEPVWTVHSLWRALQEGPLPEGIPL
jgi:8-oxo-dGTP pyrophosphatase MutT (NUDIX family)